MPTLTPTADADFYFFPADEPDMALARILELNYQKQRIAFRVDSLFVQPVFDLFCQVLAESRHSRHGAAH